jgi:hypothetical protein
MIQIRRWEGIGGGVEREEDGAGWGSFEVRYGGTYAVVVLNCLWDERVDEQGELLLCGCHFGDVWHWGCLRFFGVAVAVFSCSSCALDDVNLDVVWDARSQYSGLPLAMCN